MHFPERLAGSLIWRRQGEANPDRQLTLQAVSLRNGKLRFEVSESEGVQHTFSGRFHSNPIHAPAESKVLSGKWKTIEAGRVVESRSVEFTFDSGY